MRGLALALAITLSGCSLMLMETESPRYAPEDDGVPYCTGNRGFAYWDWLLVASYGIAALGTAASETTGDGLAVVYGLAAAGHGASAVYGHVKARDCRHMRREFQDWHAVQVEQR